MIIVTDAHVSKARNNHRDFFKMLAAIEETDHDLILLGDIFDLWIALPRYEGDIHRDFTDWCQEQKNERNIGFVEGNHEFYLASQKAYAFTWCSNKAWWQDADGTIFAHGDQVNRKDKQYLAFKKLLKNNLTQIILRGLPAGPTFADSVKRRLKKTNNKFRMRIPWDEIKFFADRRFAEGGETIFVGHFHQEYCYRSPESKKLYALPDWLGTGKVTLYRRNPAAVSTKHWRELL